MGRASDYLNKGVYETTKKNLNKDLNKLYVQAKKTKKKIRGFV